MYEKARKKQHHTTTAEPSDTTTATDKCFTTRSPWQLNPYEPPHAPLASLRHHSLDTLPGHLGFMTSFSLTHKRNRNVENDRVSLSFICPFFLSVGIFVFLLGRAVLRCPPFQTNKTQTSICMAPVETNLALQDIRAYTEPRVMNTYQGRRPFCDVTVFLLRTA